MPMQETVQDSAQKAMKAKNKETTDEKVVLNTHKKAYLAIVIDDMGISTKKTKDI